MESVVAITDTYYHGCQGAAPGHIVFKSGWLSSWLDQLYDENGWRT